MKPLIPLVLLIAFSYQLVAQETFPKEEFESRREKLFEKIGNGIGIVWGAAPKAANVKFRQSPDFYYLTGLEEQQAILLLHGPHKKVFLFAKKREGFESKFLGDHVWNKDVREEYGIDKLLAYDQFWMFLSYIEETDTIYLPLSPMDNVHEDRAEVGGLEAELMNHPIRMQPYWKVAANAIRTNLPAPKLQNINPLLDELRQIKTPYEIEQIKESARIAASGVLETIKATKAGMFEYELEAIVTSCSTRQGARGNAFAPIVASEPNSHIIHYTANNRQLQQEDFVLMDYGCDYSYYTSDITRVWPVAGKFSSHEEKMYRCILETRNTVIDSIGPGVTLKELKKMAKVIYEKHGFQNPELSWYNYLGHFVGLSVHDVVPQQGYRNISFQAGMVFNVEPVLDDPERNIHMRLEDTLLITEQGAINLTAGVPAELEEIYKLRNRQNLTGN